MVKMYSGIALAILLMISLGFSIGINQDYPSNVMLMPGQSAIYGIRIVNPSSECVGVKINNISNDNKISSIVNYKDIYYVQPNSSQKIFVNISIPYDAYKSNYAIGYSFAELAKNNSATVIDISLGAKSSIGVTVGDRTIIQAHTQKEINDELKAIHPTCDLAKEAKIIEDKMIKANELKQAQEELALNESKKNATIVQSIAGILAPEKPKSTSGSLQVSDKSAEDREFMFAAATVLILALGLALGAVMVFKNFVKKDETKPIENSP